MNDSLPSVGLSECTSLPTNPFATRWTRPGAIPFVFADGGTMLDLVARLQANEWRGAIVGPHGSGKSTLLAALVPAIAATGRRAVVIRLHDGQRRMPLSRRDFGQLRGSTVLAIDGYEQLGWWARSWLAAWCSHRGLGLLVTSHTKVRLPVVFDTVPSLSLIEQLTTNYLPNHGGLITRGDLVRAWQRHGPVVREAFFELYDVFESRRAIPGAPRSANSPLSLALTGKCDCR
jgi:hypothetical protein